MPQKDFGEDENGRITGGPFVDYNPGGGASSDMDINGDGNSKNDWRLFYNDSRDVFLIAADYVKKEKVPNTTATTSSGTGLTRHSSSSYAYSVYWNSIPSSSQWSMSTDTRDLFKYTTFRSEVNDYSGRCVSTLLNTNNWTSFVNGKFADKAIGGSTLEMWVASWNAHNNTTNYPKLYTNTRSGYGFYIGRSSSPTGYYVDLSSYQGYSNQLYFPHKSNVGNCYGYWLAAPSAGGNYSLMFVGYYGGVYSYDYTNDDLRCAPRSSSKI